MYKFDRTWRPTPHTGASVQLEERADELRTALRLLDPVDVAAKSGTAYLPLGPGRGELHVPLWGKVHLLTWPDLRIYDAQSLEAAPFVSALLLYYLVTSDDMPSAGRWISFSDLPDGRLYARAFQGYTGYELVKAFGLNLERFRQVCHKAGGLPALAGDAAFTFQAFPRLTLMAVYHLGDEEFLSTCNILFDASATHYLPTDVCATLGSMLTQRILRLQSPS
jgi:hypothetical protein